MAPILTLTITLKKKGNRCRETYVLRVQVNLGVYSTHALFTFLPSLP